MKLVVAEKPSVARSIAKVLGAESFQGGYIVGNGYVVSWCIGHLVELAEPESYGEQWKTWSYASLPIKPEQWKYKIKGETKAQFEVLCYLMNDEDVTEIICATDAGREGELIFRLVYELSGSSKPIKRLWISSMEERAIKDGFAHLKAGSEYENLYHCALCRQKADWLIGINGTRLFTILYGNKVLKVGRVQTPTLAMLAEREKAIKNFEREQYFVTHLLCDGMDMVTEHLKNRTEAERVAGACRNGQALVISVTKEEKQAAPPKLYDLTTLQRESNRLFGFTAKQTLEYAQSLYEKKLLTYPRTDSRYLSEDMGETASDVIRSIFGKMSFVPQVMFQPDLKKVLNSKKVTDHHAIIPTMEIEKVQLETLPETERKLLCLVACKLLCATSEFYIYEAIKAEFLCEDYLFYCSGKSVVKDGWKLFEDAFKKHFKTSEEKITEKKLPKLAEGMIFDVMGTRVTEHYTSPPAHFTEDTLLSFMERAGSGEMKDDVERKGLGTPATRADIIEKLIRDGFVQRDRKYLIPTEDGEKLLLILPDSMKSPKLTADWENALTLVAKGELEEDTFLRGIEAMVNEMIESNSKPKAEYRKFFVREQDMLGDCPKCGNPILKGKYGAYCMGKCGMNISKYFKTAFTDMQIRELLAGKQILLKGLSGKNNRTYDVFLKPTGIEEYSYEKNGKTVTGYQFVYEKSYPKKSAKTKKK